MKHIKLFEEFEEFNKPTMFQKALKGTKQFFGIESKEDRETIEELHRKISNDISKKGTDELIATKNVREIKPQVIVCNILNDTLTVDKNDNTIMYKGKDLQLKDIELECDRIYQALSRFLPKPNYDIVKNTKRTRDVDPYEGLPPYEREDF